MLQHRLDMHCLWALQAGEQLGDPVEPHPHRHITGPVQLRTHHAWGEGWEGRKRKRIKKRAGSDRDWVNGYFRRSSTPVVTYPGGLKMETAILGAVRTNMKHDREIRGIRVE